jgi:hypothetical protein
MKKITCIQNYVIDKLIEDEKLSTNSLLDAVSKVCSEEQFNNILSILIETPILCTDVPKLERKEDSGNKTKGSITRTKIDEIAKKLKPYGIIIP